MYIKNNKKISIIGTGKIGRSYGELWSKSGYEVTFGSRTPNKIINILENAIVVSIEEAVKLNDIILIAIPHDSLKTVINSLKDLFKNKLIIDATNPYGLILDFKIINTLPNNMTEGEYISFLLPENFIVRAFNHIQEELIVNRATREKGIWAMAIAGENKQAKDLVSDLIIDVGFMPVDIGGLKESRHLDPGGILFPNMFVKGDMLALIAKS